MSLSGNIAAINEHKRKADESRVVSERVADAIVRFSGSVSFIIFHAVWFTVWIVLNLGWLGFGQFDPFPFGLLTTIVSLEAIFLSTFVLVSQNREAALADRQSQLDLQIDLLAEHEVTRLLELQEAIAKALNVDLPKVDDLPELEQDVKPEAVLEKLEQEDGGAEKGGRRSKKKKS